jgi:hypothetical protein
MSDFLNACKLVQKMLLLCRFKQYLAAFPAGCPEEFSDYFIETNVDYRGDKLNVPEVSWAFTCSA